MNPSDTSACADILVNLAYGTKDTYVNGNAVSMLQDFLNSNGFLTVNPTGYFGRATLAAVKSFQTANGISGTGYVGPITRAKIKAIDCNGASINGVTPLVSNTQNTVAPTNNTNTTPATNNSITNATTVPTNNFYAKLSINGSEASSQNLPEGYYNFTWSTNAVYCRASGDPYWTGFKSRTGGTENIWAGNEKTLVTTYDLSCYGPSGELLAKKDIKVTFSSPSVPTITSVSPTSGTTNTHVTIYGTNLTGASEIDFYDSNNVLRGGITSSTVYPITSSNNQVQFTIGGTFVGMTAGEGISQISVVTPGPGGINSNKLPFTVTSSVTTVPLPTAMLTVSSPKYSADGTSGIFTYTWSSQNTEYCLGIMGERLGTSGSTIYPFTGSGSQTYGVRCFNSSGTEADASATLDHTKPAPTSAPTVNLTANGSSASIINLTSTQNLIMSYNSLNAQSCVESGGWSGGVTAAILGQLLAAPNDISANYIAGQIPPVPFTVTCTGPGGITTKTITVNITAPVVVAPAPVACVQSTGTTQAPSLTTTQMVHLQSRLLLQMGERHYVKVKHIISFGIQKMLTR